MFDAAQNGAATRLCGNDWRDIYYLITHRPAHNGCNERLFNVFVQVSGTHIDDMYGGKYRAHVLDFDARENITHEGATLKDEMCGAALHSAYSISFLSMCARPWLQRAGRG